MHTPTNTSREWSRGRALNAKGEPSYVNRRRRIVLLAKGLGYLWRVVDDFGACYGQGKARTQLLARRAGRAVIEANPI